MLLADAVVWVGLSRLVLAVAPTSSAQIAPADPGAPGDRSYAGPRSVEAREPSGLEAVPPPQSTSSVPAAPALPSTTPGQRSTADGSQAPLRFIDAVSVPPPRDPSRPRAGPARMLGGPHGPAQAERAVLGARQHPVTFWPGLQLRSQLGAVSPFEIDQDGARYEDGAVATGRIRWNPVLGLGRDNAVQLEGMLDVANGRWAPRDVAAPLDAIVEDGQPPVRTQLRAIDPRELYVQWTSRAGQLRVGQMSFGWGLGLVANDGNTADTFGDLRFGNDGDGSIQERILFATKPFSKLHNRARDLVVAVAADLVFRDPNANLVQGDRAGQGLLVVRWEPRERPGSWAGGYVAYRAQRSADDGDLTQGDNALNVAIVDIAGQGTLELDRRPQARDDLQLIGAFEGALLRGRTSFVRGERTSHRILQGGIAGRGYLGNPRHWLAGLDAGWFSGDGDPGDDQLNGFDAAPGYTAGLLLFDYVRGWQTAQAQLLAEDPILSAEPAAGTQYLPSGGRVGNVVFAHPKARYVFAERFEVWGGPLFAASSALLVDPYQAQLGGGGPTNALGAQVQRRGLGTELDLGLRGRYDFRELWFQAGVQGGVLFPGAALARPDGSRDGPVYGGWLRAEIRY